MPKTPKPHEVKLQRLPSLSYGQGPRECSLGMESNDIPDDSITASSTAAHSSPFNARLNFKEGAWSAGSASADSHLQVDLGSLYDVTSVATQGGGEAREDFVKAYKLQFSINGKNWEFYHYDDNPTQIFVGNKNCHSIVRRNLLKRTRARFVRFCPVEWISWPSMRVEVYGVPIGKATYETSISITDVYGDGVNGCPTLQFYMQLFGEQGYTWKIPLEISANEQDKEMEILLFKRKITAADVGWVKHIKMTYENGPMVSSDSRPSLVQRLRRMSSTSSDNNVPIHHESGFFVDEIGIDIAETGQHFTFPCKRWLLQGATAFDATHRNKSRIASATSNVSINDEDFEHILMQEEEDTEDWKRHKRPAGIQSWSRQPKKMETTRLTKTTFDLDGIPYNDAIRLITDWDLRKKWDQTFEQVITLEDDGDSNVIYCCMKMPRLFRTWDVILAVTDRRYNGRDPHHVIVWCSTEHSSVSETSQSTLSRLNIRLSGMVIRPKDNGTRSSKATLLTRMKMHEGVPRPMKNTYLNGRPTEWIKNMLEHYVEHGVREIKENGTDDVF